MSSGPADADDSALQFGWLWLNHQFSDFILELHIHPPLQEEGDDGEGALTSGLVAPSPIKRACTPAVPPPGAAAGPALPPLPDAEDRAGAPGAAGLPRPPWEDDVDAAAAEGGGGAGGAGDGLGVSEGEGEGRNVRFTSLQSRRVPATAATATVLGGGGGRGGGAGSRSNGGAGRRGGKAPASGPPPLGGVGGGHRVSSHGQGQGQGASFATIERGGLSAAATAAAPSDAQATSAAARRPMGWRPPQSTASGSGAGATATTAAAAAAGSPSSRPAGMAAGRPVTGIAAARSEPVAVATAVASQPSAAAAAAAAPVPAAHAAAARSQPQRSALRPQASADGGGGGTAATAAGAAAAADTLPGRDQRAPPSSLRRDANPAVGGGSGRGGGGGGGERPSRRHAAAEASATQDVAVSGAGSGVGGVGSRVGGGRGAGGAGGDTSLLDGRREADLELWPAGPFTLTSTERADGASPASETVSAFSAAAAAASGAPPEATAAAATSAFEAAGVSLPWQSTAAAEEAPPEVPPRGALTIARSHSAPAPREGLGPYDALDAPAALEVDHGDAGAAGAGAAATPTGWEAAAGLEPSGSWDEGMSYDEASAVARDLALYGTSPAAAAAGSPSSRRDSWASGSGEALPGGGSGAVCWGNAAGGAGGGGGGGVCTRSLGRSVAAAAPPRRRPPVRVFPVHAAVLAATSEYFRTLLRNWSDGLQGGAGAGGGGGRGVLTMYVDDEQVEAAEMMLQFMYTGRLPSGLTPSQLLALLVLADQYAVGRLLAAVDAAFAGLPLPGLSLEQLLRLYELPEVLLAGGALASALSKLVEKLTSELGDLELVLDCPARRAQLLGLPYEAVRLLLQSPDTRVWNENTAVAALVEWVAGPAGATASPEQRRQLAASLRLQHCTHSYLSYIIPQIPWLLSSLVPTRLLLALSWARADASTRDVYTAERYFENTTSPTAQQQQQQQQQTQAPQPEQQQATEDRGDSAAATAAAAVADGAAAASAPSQPTPAGGSPAAASAAAAAAAAPPAPLPVFVSRPRPVSQRVTFDWSIDFATLQQLYADSRATRSLQVVTSEPAFFGGFHWWLRYDLDASQPSEYREHMGLACNVKLAGRKHSLPCVKVKATVCARQDAGVLGEGSYSLRKSFSYHVMNACPVGLWGFFGLTPDRDEAAWRRFVFEGRVWLRCSIEECQ